MDLNALVSTMEKMLSRLIGEDIHLVTALSADIGRIKVDPGQIEQVIVNLAVNSRDATPEGGKLAIETARVELDAADPARPIDIPPGPYVRLSLRDAGTGMTAEVRSPLFEPFFPTKEEGKGTGLGLAVRKARLISRGAFQTTSLMRTAYFGRSSVMSETAPSTSSTLTVSLRRAWSRGSGSSKRAPIMRSIDWWGAILVRISRLWLNFCPSSG